MIIKPIYFNDDLIKDGFLMQDSNRCPLLYPLSIHSQQNIYLQAVWAYRVSILRFNQTWF